MINRVFIVLLILQASSFSHAQSWHEQLQETLQTQLGQEVELMAQNMNLLDFQPHINISYLDSRLNLSLCSDPLTLTPPQPLKLGRNHVKVACKTGKQWALNVPVDINLMTQVVVLNQPIPKGLSLKESHLDYQMQNLAGLRNGYYLKKEQVIGKQTKRSLQGLTVLNSHIILPALMIRKGDEVIISASKGAMSVKMPGEALNDGREGRQIRVKNNRSQRIIKATVVAVGLVEVQF